jgi:hypothetical protein
MSPVSMPPESPGYRGRKVPAEQRRERLTGAVKPYFDGRGRHPESGGRFIRRELLDIAQQQNSPVVLGQLVDARSHERAGFLTLMERIGR